MSDIIIKNSEDNIRKILSGKMPELTTVNKDDLIKAINEVKSSIPTSVQVVDNLTSTSVDKALSANQGKVLDTNKLNKTDAIGKKGTGEGAEIFNKYETNEEDGNANVASGRFSHAEGWSTQAQGEATHAEGMDTVASEQGAHSEGLGTSAKAPRAHAEGYATRALGVSSHAEGQETVANGDYAHAEGERTTASSSHQHVEGRCNIEDLNNKYIHIVGNGNYDDGEGTNTPSNAHTIDWNGIGWFKGGLKIGGNGQDDSNAVEVATKADLDNAGVGKKGTGEGAEIFNLYTDVSAGIFNSADGKYSHAEGYDSHAAGNYSHSEGDTSQANGEGSHAEGSGGTAIGDYSHVEGSGNIADGASSHAEGISNYSNNKASHAEGINTTSGASGFKIVSCTDGDTEGTGSYVIEISDVDALYMESFSAPDIVGLMFMNGGTYAMCRVVADTFTEATKTIGISEGYKNIASGNTAYLLTANGLPGSKLIESAQATHSEGKETKALAPYSHAEGLQTLAGGNNAHAEGKNTEAMDFAAHAEGYHSFANGVGSHAEGYYATANGYYSHAEGDNTFANGDVSHAEGQGTIAEGDYSSAHGINTVAGGCRAFKINLLEELGTDGARFLLDSVEGLEVNDVFSITGQDKNTLREVNLYDLGKIIRIDTSMKRVTVDTNLDNFVSNIKVVDIGKFYVLAKPTIGTVNLKYEAAFSEGKNTMALGEGSHTEGRATMALGEVSHAEGDSVKAIGYCSHAEGNTTKAISDHSSAHGKLTVAGSKVFKIKYFSDAKKSYMLETVTGLAVGDVFSLKLKNNYENYGKITAISGNVVIVDNYVAQETGGDDLFRVVAKPEIGTIDFGMGAFAEGESTIAAGENSHAEGQSTIASGFCSHAEGNSTKAEGNNSHAEGEGTSARGKSSHAEGYNTKAEGVYAHAEGGEAKAEGNYSHAEGMNTTAQREASHAEGVDTSAITSGAHSEGIRTQAEGDNGSHSEGWYTVAMGESQHVQGKCNIEDTENKYAHIVGNGEDWTARSNAHTLDWQGNAWFAGNVKVGGTGQDDVSAKEVAIKEEVTPRNTVSGYPIVLTDCLKEENILSCKVYGNCGKNMIPYPYEETTKTVNGITFTDNGDGTVTANGTATDTAQYWVTTTSKTSPVNYPAGDYIFTGCPSGGSVTTYRINFAEGSDANASYDIDKNDLGTGVAFSAPNGIKLLYAKIRINSGVVCDNLVFKPQLELGSTATEFEKYEAVGDLDSTSGKYIVPVTIEGKNILPIVSSFSVTGTALNMRVNFLPGTYTLSWSSSVWGGEKGPAIQFQKNNIKVFSLATNGGNQTITLTVPETGINIYANDGFSSSMNITSTIKELQLEKGTIATEYEEWVPSSSINISLDTPLNLGEYVDVINKKRINGDIETEVTVTGELKTVDSKENTIVCGSTVSPSKFEIEYYQDINKVLQVNNITSIASTVSNNILVLNSRTDTRLTSTDITTLTLQLPTTIEEDYECYFSFKSGSTATMITIPTGIKWVGVDCNANKEFTPSTNTIYEVGIRCIGFDSEEKPILTARVGGY